MLRNSFIMLDGIGKEKEKRLWQEGVHDWKTFRDRTLGMGIKRKHRLDSQVMRLEKALCEEDSGFFAQLLPAAEMWRLYSSFKENSVYLDIETTGISGEITVVGLYDGTRSISLVKGINLNRQNLSIYLFGRKTVITFNGASFDIPHLERLYPGIIRIPHIDLRTVCQRCGLSGGLKHIEAELGILRNEDIGKLHGGDAALLWRYYRATLDRHYLDMLLEYNEDDTVNLQKVAEIACSKLEREIRRKHFRGV